MTRIVFATWGAPSLNAKLREQFYIQVAFSRQPVVNILATRSYPKEIENCIEYARFLLKKGIDCYLWLDSGAFTAWTQGIVYKVSEYRDFLFRILPKLRVFKKVFIVSLDRIPGIYKQVVTQGDLEFATEQNLKNFYYLITNGINALPIHHQGEPLWVMQEYLKIVDYVGISPANDTPMQARVNYLKSLLPLFIAKDKIIATHNFGNIAPQQLKVFPFWSGDSATWAACLKFGNPSVPHILKRTKRNSKTLDSLRAKKFRINTLVTDVNQTLEYEKDITDFWNHKGVSIKEPKGVIL